MTDVCTETRSEGSYVDNKIIIDIKVSHLVLLNDKERIKVVTKTSVKITIYHFIIASLYAKGTS